jgi:hypothetical protein
VKIEAVVSRGGRPDLAGRSLANVFAPTLLIVGGRDEGILTCSKNRARSSRWRSWRATGSSSI